MEIRYIPRLNAYKITITKYVSAREFSSHIPIKYKEVYHIKKDNKKS